MQGPSAEEHLRRVKGAPVGEANTSDAGRGFRSAEERGDLGVGEHGEIAPRAQRS